MLKRFILRIRRRKGIFIFQLCFKLESVTVVSSYKAGRMEGLIYYTFDPPKFCFTALLQAEPLLSHKPGEWQVAGVLTSCPLALVSAALAHRRPLDGNQKLWEVEKGKLTILSPHPLFCSLLKPSVPIISPFSQKCALVQLTPPTH